MGLKAPNYTPLLPFSGAKAYVDPVPANASFPAAADATQHALATAGHHYGASVGMYLTAGTYKVFCPVPPSVVYMQVTLLMQGDATVTVNSSSTGTVKSWTSGGNADSVFSTYPMKTSGLPGDSVNSPLKVRSSAAWTWALDIVTFVLTGAGTIHAVGFEPVWEAQST